jgi:hypothetical protein
VFIQGYHPDKHGRKTIRFLKPEWFSKHKVNKITLDYCTDLLIEGNILTFHEFYGRGSKHLDLTMEGHDLLDEIRDPKWFAKIKKRIGDKPWTIETIRKTHRQLKKAANMVAGIIVGTIANWILAIIASGIAWLFGFFG